ncbi:MAG: EF-hand domain-containing protein, partial [Verrucomicrobiota bacterium]
AIFRSFAMRNIKCYMVLDTNADGLLSLEEFKAGPAGQKSTTKAEEYFKLLDKNSDGNVTLEEFQHHGQ